LLLLLLVHHHGVVHPLSPERSGLHTVEHLLLLLLHGISVVVHHASSEGLLLLHHNIGVRVEATGAGATWHEPFGLSILLKAAETRRAALAGSPELVEVITCRE